MTLTKQHIDSLYKFTRQHYVEHYDVQTELVDHLANAIETLLQDEPNLSFEEARDLCFKKFGVFGFMDIVKQKSRAINKRYWLLVWNAFISFLKPPKLVLTGLLVWVLYLTANHFENKMFVFTPLAILVFSIALISFYKTYKQVKQRTKLTGKKWLIDTTFTQLGGGVYLFSFLFNIDSIIPFVNTSQWYVLMFCTLAVFVMLTQYIIIMIVKPKLQQQFSQTHTDYLLV